MEGVGNLGRIVVIGAGFSGLRAAMGLADLNIDAMVLEARPILGGRARSFPDPDTGEVMDNGQHLFLSGYGHTMEFLERLGTKDRLVFQDRLRVGFIAPYGKMIRLDCPPLPAPWHLWVGLSRLFGVGLRTQWGWWRMWRALRQETQDHRDGFEECTVQQWLKRFGQGERVMKLFWVPLSVAVLNEDPTVASCVGFKQVLRQLLFDPWPSSRLGMAAVGLSDLYAEPARRWLEERRIPVLPQRPVAALECEGHLVKAVRLADGEAIPTEGVILALSPMALKRLIERSGLMDSPLGDVVNRFQGSAILSVNLWLDRPITEEFFVAMIGTRFQWFFNKRAILALAGIETRYVSLIMSAASSIMDQTNDALGRLAWEELQACFPLARQARLIRYQVIREMEATYSPRLGMERMRPIPGRVDGWENLFLAGDWTATGLPATIESAVISGQKAAQAVGNWLAGIRENRYNNPIAHEPAV